MNLNLKFAVPMTALRREFHIKTAMFVLIAGLCGYQAAADTSGPLPSTPDLCHFDHQLVTLSHDTFVSLQMFLSDKQNSQQINASWENDSSPPRGLLKFSDGTYMEIWDASKMATPGMLPDEIGFQDACRVKSFDSILQRAVHYRVGLVDLRPYMGAVGRTGNTGDPVGGMFFIWCGIGSDGTPCPELDDTKFGIQLILKNVPSDSQGKPNARLISDYTDGGMNISIQNDVLRAVDYIGRTRVATANPAYPVGLVAVRFSRPNKDSLDIEIPKSSGKSDQLSLQLRPGYGTLIFQPNVFKLTPGLLDAPAVPK
jgi:hypothetical protein